MPKYFFSPNLFALFASSSRRITLTVMALCMLLSSVNAGAWFDCAWLRRTPIVINNASGATQTNYHVELRLLPSNMPSYVWANGDNDLRFVAADDTTVLAHFSMPRLNTTQETIVWVNMPTLPTGNTTIYLYYNNASAASVSTNAILSPGIRYHTRQSTVGLIGSYDAWWSAWNAGGNTAGYGCRIINDFTNVSNGNTITGGSTANLIYNITGVLIPDTSATWRFRTSPDYGWGGALYLNDVPLESAWATNLWWNSTWGGDADSAQTLYGTRAITNGSNYVFRSLGGEDGADGPANMQFSRTPLLGWAATNTTNFTLRAPKCELPSISKSFQSVQAGEFTLAKTVAPYADPFNATTNPKLIPGARARYTITATNAGGRGTDSNSISITDAIPANTQLYVGNLVASGPVIFTQGAPSSSLTYTYTSLASTADDVSFSNNNAASYAYTPTPDANGFDSAVTHVAFNPKGQFSCAATSVTPKPSFSLQFDVGIK